MEISVGSKSRRPNRKDREITSGMQMSSAAHIMIYYFQALVFSFLPPDTPPVLIVKCVISYKATNDWSSSKHLGAEDNKQFCLNLQDK